MELITAHIGADFDALASLVAMKKLYPQAKAVLPGSPEKSVRDFLSFWKDELHLDNENDIDLDKVTKLIIIETRIPSRIGRAKELLGKKCVEIEIYDHHPRTRYDIKARKDIYKPTGATITMLLDILKKKKIGISPFEATIMALGIYEDTGSLTFQNTTRQDVDAVGYLFSQGASLSVVTSYLRRELTQKQLAFLSVLINRTKDYLINGVHVGITEVESDEYIEDFSSLVHKLIDIENLNVIFAFSRVDSKIRMVARSHIPYVKVDKIAEYFGGGGHPYAASAIICDMKFKDVVNKLLELLRARIKATHQELVGEKRLISHRNRQAQLPKSISGRMRKNLPSDIFKIIKLAGDISDKRGYNVYCVGGFVRDMLLGVNNFDVDIVLENEGLAFAKELADILGGSLVIHKRFGTATIVTDLKPQQERGPESRREKFKIDVATARTEYYEHPAALPIVSFSSIKQDLYRRDFTINAMAVSLNRKSFGMLIDFFNGQRDLRSKKIRTLHDLSFVEDPTRIFRAVRFEQRYNFTIEPHTERLIKTAVSLDMFGRTQKQRLRDELILILSEERPQKALKRMHQLHELRFIHPSIKLTREMLELFDAIDDTRSWYESSFVRRSSRRCKDMKRPIDSWIVYLFAIINGMGLREIKRLCEKFVFSKGDENRILSCKEHAGKIIKALEVKAEVPPSRIYRYLEPLSYEVILFMVAKTRSQRAKERISLFLSKYNGAKPLVSGKDLKVIGVTPGPIYKKILNKILYDKLDGIIDSKTGELEAAKKLSDKV